MSTDSSNNNSPTDTEFEQRETEKSLSRYYLNNAPPEGCKISLLARHRHISWLTERLTETSSQHLDSSRPWLVYWPLHTLDLMQGTSRVLTTRTAKMTSSCTFKTLGEALFDWIFKCWAYVEDTDDRQDQRHPFLNGNNIAGGENNKINKTCMGGFCGGWGFQAPHLASCWAACASLIILCDEMPKLRPLLKDRLDRTALTNWLNSLRTEEGGFKMFSRGEVDLRASYCAACIATVFDLDAERLFPLVCMKFIGRCQGLDGGISSNIHGSEGHGGYVSCGFLALLLMHCLRENQQRRRTGKNNHNNNRDAAASESDDAPLLSSSFISDNYCLDVHQLRRWCALRQDPCVGAFSGRVNKLVDSCYSWWVGGTLSALALVDAVEDATTTTNSDEEDDENISKQMKRVMKMRSLNLVQHGMLLPEKVTQKILRKVALVEEAGDEKNDDNNNNRTEEENNKSDAQDENNDKNQEQQQQPQWVDESLDDGGDYSFNQDALAEYVLELCQSKFGGLADKPDLSPDLYHSCYSLSGLSTAVERTGKYDESIGNELKNILNNNNNNNIGSSSVEKVRTDETAQESASSASVIDDLLKEAYQFQHFEATQSLKQTPFQTTHPLLNLTRKRVKFALEFFGGRDSLI